MIWKVSDTTIYIIGVAFLIGFFPVAYFMPILLFPYCLAWIFWAFATVDGDADRNEFYNWCKGDQK